MNSEKWGLVLCGGGAKGAYQIGAWRALRELGRDQFAGISGASVGALNAALWAAGDLEAACRIWEDVRWGDFVTPSGRIDRIASREGLRRIIRERLDLAAVRESRIPLYADILSAKNLQVEYRRLNGQSDRTIEELLLATSSIPAFYGKSKVEGADYWDGGFTIGGDNAPFRPLYEQEGIRSFIVIELYDHEHVKVPEDCRLIRIHPRYSLGNLLHFGKDAIAQRMEQGYRDTLAVLSGRSIMMQQEEALRNAVHSAEEMERFFTVCQYPNAQLAVTDAGVFWDEICELYGYRLQRNRLGLNHRILDSRSVRRAWWLSQEHFLEDIARFSRTSSSSTGRT